MRREIITDEDDRVLGDHQVDYTTRSSPLARFVWFVLGIVNTLLAIRFLMKLFAAAQGTGLGSFINSVTDPLVRPFSGLVRSTASSTGTFDWPTIQAMVVYWLAAWAIARLASTTRPVARY